MWWCLWWLLLTLVSQSLNKSPQDNNKRQGVPEAIQHMEYVNNILTRGCWSNCTEIIEHLEEILEQIEVDEPMSISLHHLVAALHKPKYPFKGLEIYATENKATSHSSFPNNKVTVQLPSELDTGSGNTIVFCMITFPQTNGNIFGAPDVVYENRLVGLSVRSKNISGLRERVNITMTLTTSVNETQKLMCAFYDFSKKTFCYDGCQTLWEHGQSYITCSCDHLTYFSVLMLSANPSPRDQEILTNITLIGCSLSLLALVITVFLFIINRNFRSDVTMKIHINLTIALILLNIHLLPSKAVAALSSTGLCLYMALCLHYSLLATFSWMALEGFHIYLLLVRVFNIYVKRYLLKLTVVGWGIPAVIVSLVIIIERDAYGHVHLDSSNPNSTEICYITNSTVKTVTTVGIFALVFIFNVTLAGVTVRRVLSAKSDESDSNRVKRDVCTLLGIITLLGITWGLIFFSFGYLTTPGMYLFCVLNPLQGFFIFIWFVMSVRKKRTSALKQSKETCTSNS